MFLDEKIVRSYCFIKSSTSDIYWERFIESCDINNIDLIDTFEPHKDILKHIFSLSPFLSENIINDAQWWNKVSDDKPEDIFKSLIKKTKNAGFEKDQTKLMKKLRVIKRRIATLCGFMDITGIWDVISVTKNLSIFASTACHTTLNHSIRNLADMGIIEIDNNEDPASNSGFVILGMGKLGGDELNYSSDIDLIAFFDTDKTGATDYNKLCEKSVKVFKNFITIMQNITRDGYVFRTDMRLRPNPSMTPLIMSKNAMLQYYETMGLNWERSAMIKARPIAGDITVGNQFLEDIHSFIWRKNLDFEALEDIYSIKLKINKHRMYKNLKIYGHNVKLGLGGIREIEFFAQSQQMIWGGRINSLRSNKLLDTLQELANLKQIEQSTCNQLVDAYLYLRKLEHRLQMIADKQTHSIPETQKELETVSNFMGYNNVTEFEKITMHHLTTVADIYTKLFQDNFIDKPFNDNKSQKYINEFSDMDKINAIIKKWQSGIYRSTRTERALHLLNGLTPTILNAFSQNPSPDESFMRFDNFLERLPAGIQLFSLFKSNPKLLDIIAKIIGNAPRLTNHLVSTPNLLNSLVTKRYQNEVPKLSELQNILNSYLNDARDYQDVLESVRLFKWEIFFDQGVRVLENFAKPNDISLGLSRVADLSINRLIPNVCKNMEYSAGKMPDGNFAILAFGKLGGNEIMHRSDVDLVFIYDHSNMKQKSTGNRAISPPEYYTKFFQRVINAITTVTAQGELFKVDVRLRPNGNSGSVATHIDNFVKYYKNQAWTWEFMALTKARVVYSSSDKLKTKIENSILNSILQERKSEQIKLDIIEMRQKLENEFFDGTPWFIKHRPGGLVSIEFLAQGLQLIHAKEHPKLVNKNTFDMLKSLLEENIIDTYDYTILNNALILWYNIQGIIRLTTPDRFFEEKATVGQKQSLLNATGFDNLDILRNTVEQTFLNVRKIFDKYLNEKEKYDHGSTRLSR